MKQTIQTQFSDNFLNFSIFNISRALNDNDLLLDYFQLKEIEDNPASILSKNLMRQYLMIVQTIIRLNIPVTLGDINIDCISGKAPDSPEVILCLRNNIHYLKAKYQRLGNYSRINQLASASAYVSYLRSSLRDMIVIDQIDPFNLVFDYQDQSLPYYPLIRTFKAKTTIKSSVKLSATAVAYYHISKADIPEVTTLLSQKDIIIFS